MKKPLLLLLCLFTVIGYAKDPHIKAVYALIERVTPGYGKQIKLQLIDPANGEDVYGNLIRKRESPFERE